MSRPGRRGQRSALARLPLHSYEWLALLALALCGAALGANGLAVAPASLRETAVAMAATLPAALLLGVFLQGTYRFALRRDLRRYARSVLRRRWLADWLRLWLACWAASFAYFWLKVYVPLLHPGGLDAELLALDRWLHLGVSPSQLAARWLGGTAAAGWLDAWYALWLASLVWCLAFFAASNDERLRRGVVASCVMLWLLGSWLYVALPVVGPAFAGPAPWSELAGPLPRAEAAQTLLWHNHGRVLASGGDDPGSFRHTLGVAALPSLHVGFHGLFTLWARVAARPLFVPFLAATVATFIGSLLTGWHYALDGYVGLALAGLCFSLARRLERAPEPDAPPG